MNPHIHWNRRFTKRWRLNSVRAGGPAVFTKFVIPRCSDVCMCASFSLGLGFFPPACRHRTTKSCRSRVSLCWSGLWQLGINLSLLTMVFLGDSHKSLTFYWYAVLIWRSWREPRGRDWDRKLPITTNHRSFFPHSNQILVGFPCCISTTPLKSKINVRKMPGPSNYLPDALELSKRNPRNPKSHL